MKNTKIQESAWHRIWHIVSVQLMLLIKMIVTIIIYGIITKSLFSNESYPFLSIFFHFFTAFEFRISGILSSKI